jgi:hypothetical protein
VKTGEDNETSDGAVARFVVERLVEWEEDRLDLYGTYKSISRAHVQTETFVARQRCERYAIGEGDVPPTRSEAVKLGIGTENEGKKSGDD